MSVGAPHRALVSPARSAGSGFWRRMAWLGARHGPRWFFEYSPPLIGQFFCWSLPEARRQIERNLEQIARGGDIDDRRALVRRTFEEYAACFAEGLAVGRHEQATLDIAPEQETAEYDALRRRGAVVLTAHVGGWDLCGALLHERSGLPVKLVMGPEASESARSFHDALRADSGLSIYHPSGDDPLCALELVEFAQRPGIVAGQMDRVPPGMRAIQTRLFGEPFAVPRGLFRVAALAGVPLVVVLSHRVGFLRYRLVTHPPIEVPHSASAEQLQEAAQTAVGYLEAFVSRHPSQWFRFSER